MADIIHEHHDDSSTSVLLVVIIIIVVAIAGFLLWRYLPASQNQSNQPGVNLQINTPSTGNTGGTSGGTTY